MNQSLISWIIFGLLIYPIGSFGMKVTIDPGHGGSDSGAVHGKAREADIALNVAKYLKEILDSDPEFTSELTRKEDNTLSLNERVEIAEKSKSNILISIHANASKDKRAQGLEIYFQNHLPPDEEMLFLASIENSIQKQQSQTVENEPTKKNDVSSIVEDLKRQYRIVNSHKLSVNLLNQWDKNRIGSNSIRQAPFFMISKAAIPSALIELGFLTNPKENQKLLDASYQRQIAEKIYLGLKSYRNRNLVKKDDLGLPNL